MRTPRDGTPIFGNSHIGAWEPSGDEALEPLSRRHGHFSPGCQNGDEGPRGFVA